MAELEKEHKRMKKTAMDKVAEMKEIWPKSERVVRLYSTFISMVYL